LARWLLRARPDGGRRRVVVRCRMGCALVRRSTLRSILIVLGVSRKNASEWAGGEKGKL
jgi:hypothetical protein